MNGKDIQFNISASEVKRLSGQKVSDKEVGEVLMAIESDNVLWGNIESSIVDAINMVKKKQNEQRVQPFEL